MHMNANRDDGLVSAFFDGYSQRVGLKVLLVWIEKHEIIADGAFNLQFFQPGKWHIRQG